MCSPTPRSSSRSRSSRVSGVEDLSRLHSCRLKSRYGECGSPSPCTGSMVDERRRTPRPSKTAWGSPLQCWAVRLGDIANADAQAFGKPLAGVRVLAAEQMQALPYATQMLARLGADVVKVEPLVGESGRASQPAMLDPEGRPVGATFLRNNIDKRSVAVDLKSVAGRDLFLRLAPRFDVVAENFKAGTMDRLGLGYEAVAAVHPAVVYVSVSGFGNDGASPYTEWPAYSS